MKKSFLAELFLLQAHPFYKLQCHAWTQAISDLGFEAWKTQNSFIQIFFTSSKERLEKIQSEIEAWLLMPGQSCVSYFDSEFPENFLTLERPPLVLFYRGLPLWRQWPLLSVVGSREMRSFSSDWLDTELKQFILTLESRVGIVSGGARGVDLRSHQISLRMQAPTLAILPSGLERIYPDSFATWAEEIIAQGGCLMSEYLPSQEMRKNHFEARNRLIASLGIITLIVQGQKRSGTMLTAKQCIQNNKVVAIIPGHPTDPAFSGNLNLLREGAFPVMDAQDLTLLFKAEKSGVFEYT